MMFDKGVLPSIILSSVITGGIFLAGATLLQFNFDNQDMSLDHKYDSIIGITCPDISENKQVVGFDDCNFTELGNRGNIDIPETGEHSSQYRLVAEDVLSVYSANQVIQCREVCAETFVDQVTMCLTTDDLDLLLQCITNAQNEYDQCTQDCGNAISFPVFEVPIEREKEEISEKPEPPSE